MPLPPGIVQCAKCGLYDKLVGMYFFRDNVYCVVCKPHGAKRIVKVEFIPDDDFVMARMSHILLGDQAWFQLKNAYSRAA